MRGNSPLSLVLRVCAPVFLAVALIAGSVEAAPPAVDKVRVQSHAGFTRVVLETTAPIEPNLFTMGRPHRLVIDLPELQWRIPRPSGFVDSPLVKKFSFGLFQPGVSRLVLNLSAPTQIVGRKLSRSGRTFFYEIDLAYLPAAQPPVPLHPEKPPEPVVSLPAQPVFPVIDLPAASTVDPATKSVFEGRSFDPSKAEFDALGDVLAEALGDRLLKPEDVEVAALEPEAVPDLAPEREEIEEEGIPEPEVEAEIEKEIEAVAPKRPNRPPLRIVIDPGHGGRDPGTGSDSGVSEKDINLAFAKTLQNLLEVDPNYEVFLTREEDKSVKLTKRVQFARQKEADLFISIHADWNNNKWAKGATAYTLSEKASVKTLDDIATKREDVGKVAGVDLAAEREDVARLLVDLARRETQARSQKFAELVVAEVAKETPVLRRPLRKNSFHVLKAPDMPSVLLELGFLSNETDRKRLTSEVWRLKTAEAVKRAIDEFRIANAVRNFNTIR
jgi:N-acetylmuramoyl-L-alanine amidase